MAQLQDLQGQAQQKLQVILLQSFYFLKLLFFHKKITFCTKPLGPWSAADAVQPSLIATVSE
jgi:hypothetical protein